MKLLSIAIPCYNSAAYMENCIKSLLPGGNEVEILIVDDGSTKDNTAEIADRYEKEYPGICKAIHQENGGHGAAVNAGLKAATGIYFKVVDSDDWVNEQAYRQVLDTLRRFVYGKDTLDMLITNFVYEKQGARHKKVMSYKLALPKDELFSWNDVKVFVAGQYILMHSVIYRTELLRDCKLELPEHTFYVDNIFVYEPLPHVHTMYYLDVNFYRYFIGRSDQSVNEQVMIGRIDQQIRVTKLMLGYYDVTKIQNRKLRHYMVRYLEIMMVICSILAIKSGSEENMAKKSSPSLIADNRKARHDFHIHETYEAGIALTGTEIKSIRQGKLNLKDSFCRIDKGEILLYGVHISPYEQGNRFNHEPERTRKLLMHKSEINKLHAQVKEKGFSLVPLNFHFSHGYVKVTVGLVTGKKLYDKRQDMAERDAKRDIAKRIKEQQKY